MAKTTKEFREELETRMIREHFNNEHGLVVVAVGANQPTAPTSQSLHLEQQLGWKAILIEPNPDIALLSIDVEGAERAVLRGSTLRNIVRA